MKALDKSMVEPDRCAVGISAKSVDGHGRGALRLRRPSMHGYCRWRKGGVGLEVGESWGCVHYGYDQGEAMGMVSKCGLLNGGWLQAPPNYAKVPLVEP
jgi:hypothetical protein